MAGLLLLGSQTQPSARLERTEAKKDVLQDGVSLPLRTPPNTHPNNGNTYMPSERAYYSKARHGTVRGHPCCSRCYTERKRRNFAIIDFPYIYDYVQKLFLTDTQKQLLLVRFTMIMDKVKKHHGRFLFWHTCTKTCLIVGNIMVPSVLSIEAFFFNEETVRQIVFWFVWVLSIIIALMSSLVTFCNTQKKYNLYNQFSTKIRREIWAYLTLSGRYMVLSEHLSLLGQQTEEDLDENDVNDGITFDLGDEEPQRLSPVPIVEDSSTPAESKRSTDPTTPPLDLFEDDVAFFEVDKVPDIMRQGHMLHFQSFMNRLETLYRYLTNSNIDIEVEDMSNLDYNTAIKRSTLAPGTGVSRVPAGMS